MRAWHAVAVLVDRPLAAAVSRALVALGATGVQEDHPPGFQPRYRQPWDRGPAQRAPRRVLLRAWFDARPGADAWAAAVDGHLAGEPEWTVQPEEDWNDGWRVHFQPVRISDRLTIAAPWHGEAGAVLIEPGNAFGTGEHVTTRACLRAVDRYAVAGGQLLDVGCGSGILALAGAHLGMHARGIDTDPDAVRAAVEAATLNQLAADFDTTPLADVRGTFDLVVANLYAEVLAALAPELLRVSSGPIACAGILADRAHLVRDALGSRAILEDETDGDWVSLVFAGP